MAETLLDYVRNETQAGRRVGVFSCEDPLNTTFHRDLLSLNDRIHLKTSIAAEVDLASVELGTIHRAIDSWLVVGHTDGLRVCGAIYMAMQNMRPGGHLGQKLLAIREAQRLESTLENNIREWTRQQVARLARHIASLRETMPGLAEKQLIVRGGLIRYVGNSYISELFD